MPPKRKTSAFTGTGRTLGGKVVKSKAKALSKALKAVKELEEYVQRKDEVDSFDSSDAEDAVPAIKRQRPVRAVRGETEKKMQQEMIKTGEMRVGSSEPKKEGKDTASFAGEGRRLGGAETKGHELA